MEYSKMQTYGCYIAIIMIAFNMIACWIFKSWQDFFMPLSSLIAFLSLSILFFTHVNIVNRIRERDWELYLLIGSCLLAFINMIIIRSNVGAIFTITDFLLILYLSDKVMFPRKAILFLSIVCAGIFSYWLFIKRADYGITDFNPNGAACIIFTSAALAFSGFYYLNIHNDKLFKVWSPVFAVVFIILFQQSLNLHARSVMLGVVVVFITYYFLPKKSFTIYGVLILSILFPVIYVLLWKLGVNFTAPFTEKNLMSGREQIWNEFFKAFLKYPITGIGSDFQRMVPNAKLYEVHHALLDLLFVHGIPVFIAVLYFIWKRLKNMFRLMDNKTLAVYISVLYGMFVIGIFENYFIAAPYSLAFYMILSISFQFVLSSQMGDKNAQ